MKALVPLALVLLLAGCYPTAVEPNDVDASRLEALAAESVLAGGRQSPAEANNTSANSNAKRAHVSVSQDWSTGGGSETWPLTQELLTELRGDGWIVVQQSCEAGASGLTSAELVALKELDGFTAGMVVTIGADGAQLQAYAPFHEEADNPWGPVTSQEGGCLDSADEPLTDSKATDHSPVDLFYLRDE